MKKKILLLLALLPMMAAAQTSADTVVPRTFEFVRYGDKALYMDVYSPTVPRVDSACVVYIFGGGFVMGNRDEKSIRQFCQTLARHGFTAISIDYRLHLKEVNYDTVTLFNMQGVFREAINMAAADASSAVAYICKHATELGVSADRIVLTGCSAGAITALQVDYCRCNDLPPAAALPKGWKPAAVVSFAGGVFSDEGNPKYAKDPAPTFFMHGRIDKIVNYKKFPPILRKGMYGTKKLHRTFEKKGYPHWLFVFEGIGHEVASYHNVMLPEFEAFVDKTLKNRKMHYDATVRDDNLKPTKWSQMNVFDLYKGN
ncbi:MAG: alpha/beta hydrolase fold domain-containing protein [Bacteroidales bacterium]|nr:alpha/beta hydrolase fold domain-containing protein [Bacteroidales bacterium]